MQQHAHLGPPAATEAETQATPSVNRPEGAPRATGPGITQPAGRHNLRGAVWEGKTHDQ